jgi:nucleotide-binding universal stress UspA family protein
VTEIFKTVLFPIDQSRETREAADVVTNVVKKYSSRLVLLSVVEEPPPDAPPPDAPSADPMVSPEVVAKLLENAQSLFSGQGIQSEILERRGKPAFTICDVADEIGADLIIMGCRGLGLTEEGADDSVTTRVINLSPCPVLIVP